MACRAIGLILLLCSLMACANGIKSHLVGRQTKPESRVPIESGGPHEARWQTGDLAVIFDYQWESDQFDMAGHIELQKKIANFPMLEFLRIRAHFVDAEGVIIQTEHLWSVGHRVDVFYGLANFNFSRQFSPPRGTEMIAFSYDGGASDASSEGGFQRSGGGSADWSFWWQP